MYLTEGGRIASGEGHEKNSMAFPIFRHTLILFNYRRDKDRTEEENSQMEFTLINSLTSSAYKSA